MTKLEGRKAFGIYAEKLACDFLEASGFEIEKRNYRAKNGEIDIIARKDELVVFVEVKARKTKTYGEPVEAVTPTKIERIRGAALEYLRETGSKGKLRFDVISITFDKDGLCATIKHLPGSF